MITNQGFFCSPFLTGVVLINFQYQPRKQAFLEYKIMVKYHKRNSCWSLLLGHINIGQCTRVSKKLLFWAYSHSYSCTCGLVPQDQFRIKFDTKLQVHLLSTLGGGGIYPFYKIFCMNNISVYQQPVTKIKFIDFFNLYLSYCRWNYKCHIQNLAHFCNARSV